jgi:hypothetical protein
MSLIIRFPQDVAKELQLKNDGKPISYVELAARLTMFTGQKIDPTNAATSLKAAMIAQSAARGFIENTPEWRAVAFAAFLLALFDTPEQISKEDATVWVFCLLYHYFIRKVLLEGETYKDVTANDAYGFGKILRGREIINIANLPDMIIAKGASGVPPILASIALEWFIYIRKIEAAVPKVKESKGLVEVLITENEIESERTHAK